jgi:hypothetical protein
MFPRRFLLLPSFCLLLAACGGGVKAPDQVAGTWGADCAQPFVKFDGSKITVFPDNATYTLKSAEVTGGNLTVAYDTKQGEIREVYAIEGSTLRLDRGTYGGTEATWHKQPMNRCDSDDG